MQKLKIVLASLLMAVGISAVTVWAPSCVSAADKPLQKINVAYSSISGNMAPLWVTQDRGFFRKYGLDVQSVLIESGTTTSQALVAGDISFAAVAGPAVIQSALRGADLVMIAGTINTLTFQLFTEHGITRPDQFKGKAVGVTRYGSATDFAMRYALDKYGLDANKEVSVLQLGNVPAMLAALEAGKIQGAMLSMPTSVRAKKLGFPMLADLQMLGLEYQHTSIATSRALLKAKPDLARDFMRAFVEGIHYAKNHRRETMEIIAKYLRTEEKEILEDTYDSIIQNLVPQKPYPTLKGIQIILRELGARDPAARSARPEQFVDTAILTELENSGFIDKLYKSTAVVAKTAPRTDPAPAAASIKANVQAADAKVKVVAIEEKIKPAPKQIPATPKPAVSVTNKKAAQDYIVKSGDTLSKIAEQFYSNGAKWEKLYEANRDTLKNPNYIFVGQKLSIPTDG